MERLNFDRKCKCDWCGDIEMCSITHYGTTNYNRLICLECALAFNQKDKIINNYQYFDLQNSTIRFHDLVCDETEEEE